MLSQSNIEETLHAAPPEKVTERLVGFSCAQIGRKHGAVFLYDAKLKGLVVDFHVVEGVTVTLPAGQVLKARRDGRSNGIAFTSFETEQTYLCNDTSIDPHYARYFLEVGSVLAVPIVWQRKPLGVLTVSAFRKNAFKPEHVATLEQIAAVSAKYLRRAQLSRTTTFDGARPQLIKGLSKEWLEVEERVEQVSSTDASVLVHGESGTGKELVSRSIHFNSKRAGKPYVTVNCAAIPDSMLESVLFGHVRGAFTGATFNKLGEFQKADGGTLFLDELGELPLTLQAKVLRAIEYGEVTPLGSNEKPSRVNVRIICATNRDLPAMIREGRFRDDLYYRLAVVTIELPALRTYKDNLAILSQVFLQAAAVKHDRKVGAISPDALAVLAAYDFPGNVRELKNAIEHAVIMARGQEVQVGDLPKHLRELQATSAPPKESKRTLLKMREQWLAPLERSYLSELLEASHGNVRAAAGQAGVNTVTFYRLMEKHGLRLSRSVNPASSPSNHRQALQGG